MIRVLLVDDHALIRQGLAMAFDQTGEFHVVAQAGSVTEALTELDHRKPDVLVTDVRLPDGTGLDIVRSVRKHDQEIGIVVLTMYAGDEQVIAAMEAGASAFVGKESPSEAVISAARQAAASPRTFASAGLTDVLLRRRDARSPELTDRERQILELLAQGLGVSAIASKLFISDSTTKSHVSRIYEKLGAANRAQALVMAMKLDLIHPEPDSWTDIPGV